MSRSTFPGVLLLSTTLLACSPIAAPPIDDLRNDAGTPVDAGDDCTSIPLESAPSDQLLLVDTSQSWSSKQDRWLGATDALVTHVAASDTTYALSFFPRPGDAGDDSCQSTTYTPLDLPWGTTKEALMTSFNGVALHGKSPLGEALQGAIDAVHSHQVAGRTSSILLVTDATPDDDESCHSTDWEEVARAAAKGLDHGSRTAVHIHVLSVMGRAVSADHFSRLGTIAAEGGGFASFVNGSREDVRSSSLDALETVATRMRVCSRHIPEGLVPDAITFRFEDGSEHVVTRVANADACTDGRGFYLDDPEKPTTATVCSGFAGIGGPCELLIVKAAQLGDPTVKVQLCEQKTE